ncbi:unnamed protein product [Calypogeia fissa]
MERWKDSQPGFVAYYKKEWHKKIKVLLLTGTLTELAILHQLGTKFRTFCGGLENFSKITNGEDIPINAVANITLNYKDEEFWEAPAEEKPLVAPPLDDFSVVLKECYERIRHHATLSQIALQKLKHWRESLLKREAQQNVSRLENGEPRETLEPTEGADITTVRKRGWVDKLMGKKVRRTRKPPTEETDGNKENQPPPKEYGDIRDLVTGVNVLEKLEKKKKDKPESFQGQFDREAMEALENLCAAMSGQIAYIQDSIYRFSCRKADGLKNICMDGVGAGNLMEGGDVNTSQPSAGNTSQTTDNSQPKRGRGRGQSANTRKGVLVGPKATRARKSRVAPPFPLEKVLEQAANCGALQQPLVPRTANLIGTMRVGSSQACALSPNFQEILKSFFGRGKLSKMTQPGFL